MRKMLRLMLLVLVCVNAAYLAHRSGRAALWLLEQDDLAGATYRNFSFRNTSDGPLYDGVGIAYSGAVGLGIAAAQVGVVVAGLVLYFMPGRALKRAGWAALVGMSALWAGNLIYLGAISGNEVLWILLALHFIGLAATVIAYPRLADGAATDTGTE